VYLETFYTVYICGLWCHNVGSIYWRRENGKEREGSKTRKRVWEEKGRIEKWKERGDKNRKGKERRGLYAHTYF